MLTKIKKRIIVFGCQQIAIDCIEAISKMKETEIVALVTEERPLDKKFGYASVIPIGEKYGIPIFQPERYDEFFLEKLESYKPDIFLSLYSRKIFPPSYLKIPSLGTVNIHPGDLPFYRGPTPTLWALLNDEKRIGVSFHYVDAGTDTGGIIEKRHFSITDKDTGASLNKKAMKIGAAMVIDNFKKIMKGVVKTKTQSDKEGNYYGSFYNDLRIIRWSKKSREIFNQIRAMTRPFSGAYFKTGELEVLVWKADIIKGKYPISGPGKIFEVWNNGSFVVSTADGALKISDYELSKGDESDLKNAIKKGKRL